MCALITLSSIRHLSKTRRRRRTERRTHSRRNVIEFQLLPTNYNTIYMKYIFTGVLLILFANGFCQSDHKIDSTFNFYFTVVEIEANHYAPSKYPEYFYKIQHDSNDHDTVYINKYLDRAVNFFQGISGINAPLQENKSSYVRQFSPYVTPEIVLKWKNWYVAIRKKIIWSKNQNKPKLKK
jgi:hypothetical protein